MNLVKKEIGMTSLEVAKQINIFRAEEGDRAELRHSDLLNIIRDEFEDEIAERKISVGSYKDKNNQDRAMFELTLNQAKQILMRESKIVRKAMIKYIEELENGIVAFKTPKTFVEAMQLATNLLIENEKVVIERDEAIRTKAFIGNKREATAMNKASQLAKKNKELEIQLDINSDYATIKMMEKRTKLKFNWRLLKKVSQEQDLEIKDVFDANYGEVKAYNKKAWLIAYSITV